MSILKDLNLASTNSGACTGVWWSQNKAEGCIESINPANNELIAATYRASKQDYEHIVKTSEEAFKKWREVPAPKRAEVIRAISQELRAHKDKLGTLVSLEMGKSKAEGDGEVQEMIDMADLAVGQARMLYGKTMPSEREQHRMFEQWQPLGLVAVITAFNFPVAVWSWNAFLAAICGNTVIWKPSPKTPLCALAVQTICNNVTQELGYDGIFSLFITDNIELTQAIAKDERIALVSFTGSTQVGKQINQIVASRLGRVILELSGNNAIILDESADLQLAIPAIVFGAIGTAGQRCTTTRRLFVHEKIYQKTLDALIQAYSSVKIGDPLDSKNLLGPLIDEKAVEKFVETVAAAKSQGGEILVGGHKLDRPGYYVEPTIITAQNDWTIVQQETFAPILYVIKFSQVEEAITEQNHSRFGLSSAIFTNNIRHSELFLSCAGSDCGIANVNVGTSGAEIGGAFGGEKETGGGREAGSDAWKAYMRRQTVVINGSDKVALAQGINFKV